MLYERAFYPQFVECLISSCKGNKKGVTTYKLKMFFALPVCKMALYCYYRPFFSKDKHKVGVVRAKLWMTGWLCRSSTFLSFQCGISRV